MPTPRSSTLELTPLHISVGGASKAELLAHLERAGIKLNALAEALLADVRFTTTLAVSRLELTTVTVADLGFAQGATFAQLVERASSQGLSVGPLELAPHLRLQWTGQQEGSAGYSPTQHRAPPGSVTVASEAPQGDRDIPWGFYLRRIEGVLWLRGYRSWSGHVWRPQDAFVFVAPANAAPLEGPSP